MTLDIRNVELYARVGVPVGWDLCVGCELRGRDCPWHSESWKHIGYLEDTFKDYIIREESAFINGIR